MTDDKFPKNFVVPAKVADVRREAVDIFVECYSTTLLTEVPQYERAPSCRVCDEVELKWTPLDRNGHAANFRDL